MLAAATSGVPTAELVAHNADRFYALREGVTLSFDDFIRTNARLSLPPPA